MQSIVGTWRLVAATTCDENGQPLPPPYGAKGMGRVVFGTEGRMMAVVCDGRPELPPGAHRNYSSYCGNYTFDGARLVTRIDAASDPTRIGSNQRPPPRRSSDSTEQRESHWERIAAE